MQRNRADTFSGSIDLLERGQRRRCLADHCDDRRLRRCYCRNCKEKQLQSRTSSESSPPFDITLSLRCGEQKRQNPGHVKDWEIIADNLSKAGWSWGCVSAIDREGRTIWIADAHRDDGRRFVVRADEKLTTFLELERGICIHLLTEQI